MSLISAGSISLDSAFKIETNFCLIGLYIKMKIIFQRHLTGQPKLGPESACRKIRANTATSQIFNSWKLQLPNYK